MTKDNYTFKAAISAQLTVSEFKMTAGANDNSRNETFSTQVSSGNHQ